MMPKVRPILSEQTLTRAAKGWFTFAVDLDWNKRQIAKEVSKMYKVTVEDVRTSIRHGKVRRVGRRQKQVRKSDTKLAIVQLPKGQTIPAFEMTGEGERK